jgi:hypothetical protein
MRYKLFWKVLKIKSVFSVHASMVFKLFCCLVMEKIEAKVLACFLMKTFILTETFFKMVVAALRKPPLILKSNTVTRYKNYLNFPAI